MIKKSAPSDNRYWRCPTHKSFKVPLRLGSFFKRQCLPLRNIVELLLMWAFKEPVLNTTGITGISENTVIQWFSYFRDICSWWLNNNPYQIGGPGLTVDIDESLVAKRKNNVGRVLAQRCVFGCVCRETDQGFLVIVDNNRSAGRLLPLSRNTSPLVPSFTVTAGCLQRHSQPPSATPIPTFSGEPLTQFH